MRTVLLSLSQKWSDVLALTNQVYLRSVGTDALYNEKERYWHKRLLRLYKAKKEIKERGAKKENKKFYDWLYTLTNKIIKANKEELTKLLNENVGNNFRELNPEVLTDKTVVNLFESSLTRAIGLKSFELTDELIILNVYFFQIFKDVMMNGFSWNGEKYRFLTASAGQIRTKKAVCIKESIYNRIEQKIMCGLTMEDINAQGGINPN